MTHYHEFPDWFDTEWSDFEKPCPECGGQMRQTPLLDQGCYEGMAYRCTNRKCESQWVFRADGWIPPYWMTPICPACESLYVDFHVEDGGLHYTCSQCTATFKEPPWFEAEEE